MRTQPKTDPRKSVRTLPFEQIMETRLQEQLRKLTKKA